jgi:hypothetical protein
MAKLLDRSTEDEVSQLVVEQLDDVGFGPEEAIPGLIRTITIMAALTTNPEQALDEAADLLADTGKVL